MGSRKRLLGISLGLGTCILSASTFKFLKKDKRADENSSDREDINKNKDRKILLDGYDLKQVQVFVRHGARTPIHVIENVDQVIYHEHIMSMVPHTVFNHKVCNLEGGERPFSSYDAYYAKKLLRGGAKIGTLTALGQDQMYRVGKQISEQYIKEARLLSSSFDPEQIYIRSTNTGRTIATARCIVAGMFGHRALDNLKDPVRIHVGHQESDWLLPRTYGCHVLRQINHAAMIHGGDLPEMKDDRLQLEQVLGIKSTPNHKLNFIDLRDDIVARETHGHPVPNILQPFRTVIEKNASMVMYYAFCGQHEAERDVAVQLSSGPLIRQVLHNLEQSDSGPKLFLNACHDSTLVGMMGLLDIFEKKWPPFGSDIRFELYENKNEEKFVRVSYNGEDKVVRGCSSELCPLDEFKASMSSYAIDDKTYKEVCSSNILEIIAQEMMEIEKGEVEDEESKDRSDIPAGM